MDVFEPGQVFRFLDRLAKLTENGKLDWKQIGKAAFEAKVDRFDVRITSKDSDDLAPFIFFLGDRTEGRVLATVESDVSEPESDDDARYASELNSRLERLYTAAIRKSLGLDQVVRDFDSALRDLEDEAPF